MRLQFQKGDIAVVAAIILLALLVFLCFLPGRDAAAAVAQVYQNGELIKTVSLTEPQEFTLTGLYSNTVTVSDGRIAVTASNCPGEDCVHCGWIDSAGRSIVCLPNGVEIRVVTDNSDVDFVVG